LNTLLDAYQEIGEHMPLLEQYESHISSSPYLQEIVGLIYKDILNFHHKAMKHFRQRAWKQFYRATWRTFRTDFNAIISNLQSHRRLLDSQAIFLGINQIMKLMEELYETRRAVDEDCKRQREKDENRRRDAAFSWLSAADSATDHEDALVIHEEGVASGEWLFRQDTIKDWMDPHSLPEPILWITGRPGAGKTILASNLIEKCRSQSGTAVAYFYCKHGDPARDNFVGLARSVISQLMELNPSLVPFVLQARLRATTGINTLQSPKIVKEIFEAALQSFGDLILVIDGLDECIKSQKTEIVSWIRSATASAAADDSRNLRCCFLSQEDNDCGRLLKNLPTFRITEQHNSEDILDFCGHRASEIGKDFGLAPQDAQNLATLVAKNADGMFLYAKLVMVNLAGQVSKAALHQEMESIPPDLNQIYRRILHRILHESSPQENRVAKALLGWLLCARRPLKWHEIQGAMCLVLEDGSFDPERKLIKDIKDFCGSLIEIRKGGAICFVHLTAKYFLQADPAIPVLLEHINLTRLCFCQLSIASHDLDNPRDTIRRHILRGEFAFTEYSVVYAFEHLLDVLSDTEQEVTSRYEGLIVNLRQFVTKRVRAPNNKVSLGKQVNNKLAIFKNEDFYNGIKHAITCHKDALEKPTKDIEKESVLSLLQQLARVRSVLETMITTGSIVNLDTLYGQSLFKCSEPRCESFHTGFTTKDIRERHRDRHERNFLCSIPGCSSEIIGFSSLAALQKHEEEYHQDLDAETSFPWHGTLEHLNIKKEIEKGNYSAVQLWLSQKKPNHIYVSNFKVAAKFGQTKIANEMLHQIRSSYCAIHDVMQVCSSTAICSSIEEHIGMMLGRCEKLAEADIYKLLQRAFRSKLDGIAKEILRYPLSSLHKDTKRAGKRSHALYLNSAIRFGRDAIFHHILENHQVDPNEEDGQGRTPLIAAAEFDRTEIAAYLIKTKKCNKWAANLKGNIPLYVAGRQGHEDFIISIYHEMADDLEDREEKVKEWLRTAQLRNAARQGNDANVLELLNQGLLRTDEVDATGRSPWLWAVEKNHERVVEVFLSKTNISFLRIFKDYGKSGGRPGVLHVTAKNGNDSMMRLLLESGKFQSELGRRCEQFGRPVRGNHVFGTPLEIAKGCDQRDIVKLLEEHTAKDL
jgi:ankyrin repeat protein